MVQGRFTSRVGRQVDIRRVMHARAAAGDDDDPPADVAAFLAIPQGEVSGCGEDFNERHGEEVMRCDVYAESSVPVRVDGGPEGGLQGFQGGDFDVGHLWGVAPDAGVGAEDVEMGFAGGNV